MRLPPAPDPYNGFKSDAERRRALNTWVRWRSAAAVAVAIAVIASSDSPRLQATLAWLARALG